MLLLLCWRCTVSAGRRAQGASGFPVSRGFFRRRGSRVVYLQHSHGNSSSASNSKATKPKRQCSRVCCPNRPRGGHYSKRKARGTHSSYQATPWAPQQQEQQHQQPQQQQQMPLLLQDTPMLVQEAAKRCSVQQFSVFVARFRPTAGRDTRSPGCLSAWERR